MVNYFLEEHSPTADTANIYELHSSTSLLSLAIESLEPELVWMILDKKLANKETMTSIWEGFVAESENLARKAPTKVEKINDIERLLAHYGGVMQHSTSFRKKNHNQKSSSGLNHAKDIQKIGSNVRGPNQIGVRGRGPRRGRGSSSILGSGK